LVLAMALHQDGRLLDARTTLAETILSYDWRATQARDADGWICHLLRREAESLVLPNLPAFQRGQYQPRADDERVALLAAQPASSEFSNLQSAEDRQRREQLRSDVNALLRRVSVPE